MGALSKRDILVEEAHITVVCASSAKYIASEVSSLSLSHSTLLVDSSATEAIIQSSPQSPSFVVALNWILELVFYSQPYSHQHILT